MSERTRVFAVLLCGLGTGPVGSAYEKRVSSGAVLPEEKHFHLQAQLLKIYEREEPSWLFIVGAMAGVVISGVVGLMAARRWFLEVMDINILSYDTSGGICDEHGRALPGWEVTGSLFGYLPWLVGACLALLTVLTCLWMLGDKHKQRRRDRRLAMHFVELVERASDRLPPDVGEKIAAGEMKPEDYLKELGAKLASLNISGKGSEIETRATENFGAVLKVFFELGLVPNERKGSYFPKPIGRPVDP